MRWDERWRKLSINKWGNFSVYQSRFSMPVSVFLLSWDIPLNNHGIDLCILFLTSDYIHPSIRLRSLPSLKIRKDDEQQQNFK